MLLLLGFGERKQALQNKARTPCTHAKCITTCLLYTHRDPHPPSLRKKAKSKICLFFRAGVKIHTSTHVAELFPDKEVELQRHGPGRGLCECACVCVCAPGPCVLDSDGW